MMEDSNKSGKLKVALIKSFKDTQWISCGRINSGFLEAYQAIPKTEIKVFELYREKSSEIAESILKFHPDILVFLDHQVRLMELFRYANLISFLKINKTKIMIHVYGCFFDRLLEYGQATEILETNPFRILSASPKHADLVRKTLNISDQNVVDVIPFPVKSDTFYFSNDARKQTRKELKIKDDEILLIYSGRISGQKNVELVMQTLSIVRATRKKLKFIYIGAFNDSDLIEHERTRRTPGRQATINATLLEKIDPRLEWCFYISQVKAQELNAYLCAADAFISLSTTRGEDFGMAIAEGKSTGLPCFLSDWGGYSGFAAYPTNKYYKIKFEKDSLWIDVESLKKDLAEFMPLKDHERETLAKDFQKKFQPEKIAKDLEKSLNMTTSNFPGLNKKIGVLRKLRSGVSDFEIMGSFSHFYESYWN